MTPLRVLKARDIERLENTSFASAAPALPAIPASPAAPGIDPIFIVDGVLDGDINLGTDNTCLANSCSCGHSCDSCTCDGGQTCGNGDSCSCQSCADSCSCQSCSGGQLCCPLPTFTGCQGVGEPQILEGQPAAPAEAVAEVRRLALETPAGWHI